MKSPLCCISPPENEGQLLKRCHAIEGQTLKQIAKNLSFSVPVHPVERKGFIGQLIEAALGASAGSLPQPDFVHLGVELKTLPINAAGTPAETTYITHIPLTKLHEQHWENSSCRAKLQRVLWVPVEGEKDIPFEQRRIGQAFLWSPSLEQERDLATDWNELTTLIATGQLETIDASMGKYLHVRPKAAHSLSVCDGFDAEGNAIKTLPRGFYLRTCFTAAIMNKA